MFPFLFIGPFLTASTSLITPPVENTTSTIRSVEAQKFSTTKIGAPVIDGNLDDECWKNIPVNRDFIISTPTFGKPATLKTEVKIIYDDNAIYIAAYCYDNEPKKIQRLLTARDDNNNTDWFGLGFDTYRDKINGYRFQLSAANVQQDVRVSPNNYDVSWDAVWFSKTSIKVDGWVAEIKIPYSALRFSKAEDQTWGLQFSRYVQRNNELSSWSPVNPQVQGIVNQWGELEHLKNIRPPLRLSFVPYFTGGILREPLSFANRTFDNHKILSGGMDINWGINESFTLNTTLIPDFGQVQSDNHILNLTPFEQKFQEHRPFFTEGTELFNRSVGMGPGQLFYSRRIGQIPTRYYDIQNSVAANEEIISNPSATQLYNATKFSGRTKSGLGIGFFNSVTAPMYAVIKNTDDNSTRKEMTEPLANYNMIVLDQSLKNNSRVGFANTSVIRANGWRNANVSQFLLDLRDKTNTYSYGGFLNFSQVYDKSISAKPVFGGYGDFIASKISGNWRYDFEQYLITDKYDQNDLGILFHGNEVSTLIGAKYFDYEPKINNWDAFLSAQYTSQYKPFAYQDFTVRMGDDLVFTNFWSLSTYAETKPTHYYDYYESRTGKKFYRVPYGFVMVAMSSDYRKKFTVDASFSYAKSIIPHDPYFEGSITPKIRIKDRLILSATCDISKDFKNFGFATYQDDGEPVIGARQTYIVTNTFTAQYNITSKLFASFSARHYWSKVVYMNHYTLDDDGVLHPRDFISGIDRNFNSWNIDFVYNWRFAPGSDLIVAWKQFVYASNRKAQENYFENVRNTFMSPLTNSVSVKLVYYLDYQQMKEWADSRKQKKQIG
jgi:hypothetical protein